MTDIVFPPENAPYKVQVRFYRGLTSFPVEIVSASSLIKIGAAWLLEHGEIGQAEHDRLIRSIVPGRP
jgi:hypothetical protein